MMHRRLPGPATHLSSTSDLAIQGSRVLLTQSRHDDAREEQMLATLPARRPEALIMIGSPRQKASRATDPQ
jgi:DNA-binding LacI/PurR family transcriptional regulator